MKWLLTITVLLIFSIFGMKHTLAEDSHKHGHDEKKELSDEKDPHKHKEGDEHNGQAKSNDHPGEEEDHGHEEGEEHGHDKKEKHADGEGEEEGSSSVGPEKGILAKSDKGIQLAPEAVSTFDLKAVPFTNGSIKVSQQAIVQIKNEKSIFRLRDGWYKRVPIKIIRTAEDYATIESLDLKPGDQVVVQATGFLRMAEVAAEGGASHGHSH